MFVLFFVWFIFFSFYFYFFTFSIFFFFFFFFHFFFYFFLVPLVFTYNVLPPCQCLGFSFCSFLSFYLFFSYLESQDNVSLLYSLWDLSGRFTSLRRAGLYLWRIY